MQLPIFVYCLPTKKMAVSWGSEGWPRNLVRLECISERRQKWNSRGVSRTHPLRLKGMMAIVWTSPWQAIVKALASNDGVSGQGDWSHRQARCCLSVKSQEKTELPPFPTPREPNSRSHLHQPLPSPFLWTEIRSHVAWSQICDQTQCTVQDFTDENNFLLLHLTSGVTDFC